MEKSLEQVLAENRQMRLAGVKEQEVPWPAGWEGSLEDFSKVLRVAAKDLLPAIEYVSIEATYKDRVVLGLEDTKGKLEFYEVPYTVDKKKGIQFATPVAVKRETSWVKAEQRRSNRIQLESQRGLMRKRAGLQEEIEPGTSELSEEQRRQQKLAGIGEPSYRVLPLTESARGKRLELRETLLEAGFGILESKKRGGLTVINGRAGRVDVPTLNKRVYPRAIVQKEVARLQPLLAQGKVLGQLDHPLATEEGATRLGEVAIRYTALGIDGQGYITFEGEVVGTPKGKTLETLLDGKVHVGTSTRSWASTRKEKRGAQDVEVVLDDFELCAIDAVSDQAASGAEITSWR